MQKITLSVIRFYQRWISAALPPHCRFEPSCSNYTVQAIEQHGAGKGMLLGVQRLCKCHPFHPGGFDPVPLSSQTNQTNQTEEKI